MKKTKKAYRPSQEDLDDQAFEIYGKFYAELTAAQQANIYQMAQEVESL